MKEQKKHWMIREIYEQPEALRATLARVVREARFLPEAALPLQRFLRNTDRNLLVLASGSSRHAGLFAEVLMEEQAGTHVDVEYASEYNYRDERSVKRSAVLVVSQSGETVDTLAALRRARQMGSATLAITNVADSTMAREAEVSFPTLAGKERAVPATKSFTCQLLNLQLLAIMAGQENGRLTEEDVRALLGSLERVPEVVASQLEQWDEDALRAAGKFADAETFLFLGRGLHYPIAREGALKLKESSYIHAEGYPTGELKHGPNALVSDKTPLVVLATYEPGNANSEARYERSVQLLGDMRRQGARILAVANRGDHEVRGVADFVLEVDPLGEAPLGLTEVVPLQLFSYHLAIMKGVDVDSPRNLSKAVLTE